MKQGTVLYKIVIFLFALVLLLYMAGATWRGLRNPYPTVQAYTYSVDDTMEATGYLVRQEQALSGAGDIVRLLPAEGEKVPAGATVALLYADEAALERSQRLETLEAEVAQLSAALAAAGDRPLGDAGEQVAQTMVELRSAVEKGDFTSLENQVSAFKSAVYQQAQRYGDAGDLSAALSSAQAEIEALRVQTAQDASRVAALQAQDVRLEKGATPSGGRVTVRESGVFSGLVDGFESVLTPGILKSLTPSDLDHMEGQALPVEENQLGKLISDATWYFVFPMEEAEAKRLIEGRTVTVRFSRDWSGEVSMTVERISTPEDGRVAVILSSHRFLSETTLLRRQTVELVFSQRTGIRIPTEALRVETIQETNPETKEEQEVSQSCVYVQVGIIAERKPVTVLAQGEDYYIVEPLTPEGANEKVKKKALRSGDQVILAAKEIWDGMILE